MMAFETSRELEPMVVPPAQESHRPSTLVRREALRGNEEVLWETMHSTAEQNVRKGSAIFAVTKDVRFWHDSEEETGKRDVCLTARSGLPT